MIPRVVRRGVLSAVVLANAKAKRLAIRLTRWTGKSAEYVHPKHLLGAEAETYWYLAHVAPRDRLLDVGCGNALHTAKAARGCALAAGMDRSLESLGVGARTCRAEAVGNVHLVQADVEAPFPYRSGAFDKVLCGDLLEHVERRDHVLGEIRRVLRPEGLLL